MDQSGRRCGAITKLAARKYVACKLQPDRTSLRLLLSRTDRGTKLADKRERRAIPRRILLLYAPTRRHRRFAGSWPRSQLVQNARHTAIRMGRARVDLC